MPMCDYSRLPQAMFNQCIVLLTQTFKFLCGLLCLGVEKRINGYNQMYGVSSQSDQQNYNLKKSNANIRGAFKN